MEINAAIEEHSGLVRTVARRLAPLYGEELEDVMQIGYIGLIKAARRFDASRGLKFSTYAVPMIAGEIKAQLRDKSFLKMSRSLKSDAFLVRRVQSEYVAEHGTSPHIGQLAALAGLTFERTVEALQAAQALLHRESLEALSEGAGGVKEGGGKGALRGGLSFGGGVPFGGSGGVKGTAGGGATFGLAAQEETAEAVDRMDLANALASLEPQARQVIVLRYYRDLTQQQVGDMLGISQAQVSRIEKKTLAQMAAALQEGA